MVLEWSTINDVEFLHSRPATTNYMEAHGIDPVFVVRSKDTLFPGQDGSHSTILRIGESNILEYPICDHVQRHASDVHRSLGLAT